MAKEEYEVDNFTGNLITTMPKWDYKPSDVAWTFKSERYGSFRYRMTIDENAPDKDLEEYSKKIAEHIYKTIKLIRDNRNEK